MTDLLSAILRVNLAMGLAILLVIALRGTVRAQSGARAAYGLWLVPVVAALASLLPALRSQPLPVSSALQGPVQSLSHLASVGYAAPWPQILIIVWLTGACGLALAFAKAQARFLRMVDQGVAGPAIVGLLDPRLVLPQDFALRFSPDEQALIRAHEKAHLDSDDPRANGLIAALQCLFWFNPLIHWAARLARLDQEMACDALVMARFPKARRQYAGAMLKTQMSQDRLPVGCHWGGHPLEARILVLKAPPVSRMRSAAGTGLVAAVALACLATVWSLQPPRIELPPEAPAPHRVMDLLIVRS